MSPTTHFYFLQPSLIVAGGFLKSTIHVKFIMSPLSQFYTVFHDVMQFMCTSLRQDQIKVEDFLSITNLLL